MMEEKNLILKKERRDLKIEVDLKLLNLKNLERIEIKNKNPSKVHCKYFRRTKKRAVKTALLEFLNE